MAGGSMVLRGMGRGDVGSLVFAGMGRSGTIVVIPVEQTTDAVEALVSIGVKETDLDVQVSEVTPDVALIEVNVDPTVITPSQISSVLSRSLNVEVEEIEMTVTAGDIQMDAKFTDIVQKVSVQEHGFDIAVVQVTEETEINEAIDKRET